MERLLEPAILINELEDLLRLSTMTLATSGLDGEAHAADVYFASDEQLTLYFFSDASSQHSMDIHQDPRAAITIHHADQAGWEQILGIQMRGMVKEISSQTLWQQAWEIYQKKFPFVSDLKEVIKVNQLYGFAPGWIRLVDNSQGFGFKREWKVNTTENDGGVIRLWEQQGG